MSFQRVQELLEQTSQYCVEQNLPCSQQDLHDCVVDYDHLLTATGNHADALFIFEALIEQSVPKQRPCEWLCAELHFEAYSATLGNRGLAAMTAMNRGSQIGDDALDLYNERMKRFTAQ